MRRTALSSRSAAAEAFHFLATMKPEVASINFGAKVVAVGDPRWGYAPTHHPSPPPPPPPSAPPPPAAPPTMPPPSPPPEVAMGLVVGSIIGGVLAACTLVLIALACHARHRLRKRAGRALQLAGVDPRTDAQVA